MRICIFICLTFCLTSVLSSGRAQDLTSGGAKSEFSMQTVLASWKARSLQKRSLVEIIYTYQTELLPPGRKLLQVEDEGRKMPSLPHMEGIKTRVKVVTDGIRFRLDFLPAADGTLQLPLRGHASPYAIYDGKLYAASSGDGGVSLMDQLPYLGCPLPYEMMEFVPARLEIGAVHLWSAYSAGRYEDWFQNAQRDGSVSATDIDGKMKVMGASSKSGAEGDEEFVVVHGDPLAPTLVEAGYSLEGQRVKICDLTFGDYLAVGDWLLPKRATAIVKLNMPLAVFGVTRPGSEEKDERLKASGLFPQDIVAVYKHEVVIESINPVPDTPSLFDMPMRPGTLVHDRVTGTDYVWGREIDALEKQLKSNQSRK